MILVTGGSGFLGQHLLHELSGRGAQVRALYNSHKPEGALLQLKGVTWMQCDLLDIYAVEEAMECVTDIYHCAAKVSFDPLQRDAMLHFNPESTANIVNQAIEQGIRKMVYVSSVAALGRSGADTETKEIDEEQEWGESKYNSAYGISKYLAENEVWRGVGEGLNAVIVCPSVILGPGDWSTGSAQLMSVVNKEFKYYTNGVNGWVGVKDVVAAMVQLMATDVEAERFIVSTGNYAYKEIFTTMAHALGRKPPHIYASPFMTGLIWRANSLLSRITGANAVITRETAATAHSISNYNNSKLLQVLPGFRYMPIAESIAYMADAFRKENGI
jgi:dihydroflavonol-4-reductase